MSSGTGAKGISADGTITIGNLAANDALLNLNVTTSGNRFLVSGSGQNADYANPKAIKSLGNLTVNSGVITVKCTQTTEGGEGLESKASMYLKGGQLTVTTYDDCLNASIDIEISGGTHLFTASGNDGVDSNGTLTISGGLIISKGAGGPEGGFDCDNNTFKVLGGIMVRTVEIKVIRQQMPQLKIFLNFRLLPIKIFVLKRIKSSYFDICFTCYFWWWRRSWRSQWK